MVANHDVWTALELLTKIRDDGGWVIFRQKWRLVKFVILGKPLLMRTIRRSMRLCIVFFVPPDCFLDVNWGQFWTVLCCMVTFIMDYLLRISIPDKPKKRVINPRVVKRMISWGLIYIDMGSVTNILHVLVETLLLWRDCLFNFGHASNSFVFWCCLCLHKVKLWIDRWNQFRRIRFA